MEGMSGWIVLLGFVLVVLVVAATLLLLLAAGLRLGGQTRLALRAFSAAFLSLSLAGASTTLNMSIEEPNRRLILLAVSLSLVLAGVGQFMAAFRHPPSYLAAFLCSIGSIGFIVRPVAMDRYEWWLRSNIIGGGSFLLGAASLAIALNRVERPRDRIQRILVTISFNLTMFLIAIVNLRPDDLTGYTPRRDGFRWEQHLVDVADNTYWRWVLVVMIGSILFSTVMAVFKPKSTRPRLLAFYAALGLIAVQIGTASFGTDQASISVRRTGSTIDDTFLVSECHVVVPGLVRCVYAVFPNKNNRRERQIFEDYYFWYGFGVSRVRHRQAPESIFNPKGPFGPAREMGIFFFFGCIAKMGY